MTTLDFIGVGNIAYDLVLSVTQLPIGGGKFPVENAVRLPGGMVANATCAAAALGLTCGYVGWVGDDPGGVLLRDDFIRRGVDAAGLLTVKNGETGYTVILVDDGGERVILLPPSTMYSEAIRPEQVQLIEGARVVYSHPRGQAWCEYLIALCGNNLFALDVEWMPDIPRAVLFDIFAKTDFVFVTQTFMQQCGVESVTDIPAKKWAILTMGADGAQGYSPVDGVIHHQPAYDVRAVDTTGAGDCFHAAMIAAYLRGLALPDALAFAAAASSIAVQHHGARGGLPSVTDVEKVLNG